MEIISLTEKQRELLLKALDIDKTKMFCGYCKNKLTIKNVAILPTLVEHSYACLICGDNPLCISEYFTEVENLEEKDLEAQNHESN